VTPLQEVPLGEIDRKDTRFQFRLTSAVGDLRKSLLAQGQQVPVTLWGEKPPYKIIDGFRRIEAIADIGGAAAIAIIRGDLGEDGAFALSFTENVKRKNFSALDKAHAIWAAINRRKVKPADVADDFSLSERQLSRYLKLLDLDHTLKAAVTSGKISMAHAAVLHRSGAKDVTKLIDTVVEEKLSARQLKRMLKRTRSAGRPKLYIVRSGDGFRAYPFLFRPSMDDREKKRILRALEQAVEVVKKAL
jgi:ParB/RepB/Spo0J family partition protein